jgi:hypothetical protein
MKAEQPAQGISKKASYSDAVWYEVDCECGSPNHYHSVWIEQDAETKLVTVEITTEATTDFWTQTVPEWIEKVDAPFVNWVWQTVAYAFNETVRRAKLAARVLFRGYAKYDSTVLLTKQQAYNYAKALERSVKDLDK